MLIHTTPLEGAALIELKRLEDDRGFFARAFCRDEYTEAGLEPNIAQVNVSFNNHKGTLRGFHYQVEPSQEAKTIRCIRGSIYDVIVDVRPESPTFMQHYGAELSAENRLALHVPKGFAHAYLTLVPETETLYLASTPFTPGAERGLRWNDPDLGIAWPVEAEHISDKDAAWPLVAEVPVTGK